MWRSAELRTDLNCTEHNCVWAGRKREYLRNERKREKGQWKKVELPLIEGRCSAAINEIKTPNLGFLNHSKGKKSKHIPNWRVWVRRWSGERAAKPARTNSRSSVWDRRRRKWWGEWKALFGFDSKADQHKKGWEKCLPKKKSLNFPTNTNSGRKMAGVFRKFPPFFLWNLKWLEN